MYFTVKPSFCSVTMPARYGGDSKGKIVNIAGMCLYEGQLLTHIEQARSIWPLALQRIS